MVLVCVFPGFLLVAVPDDDLLVAKKYDDITGQG